MPNLSEAGRQVKKRRALTQEEAEALLKKTPASRKLYYVMSLYTGLRVGELEALRYSDVRWEPAPHLVLRAETPKAKRADQLPLHPKVVALLDRRADSASPIVKVPTRKTVIRDFVNAGLVVLDESGVQVPNARGETLDRHALRTTFVTWLSAGGVAPRMVQALARHSTLDLTMQTYTDERVLDLQTAINHLP